MSLVDWIQSNLTFQHGDLVAAVLLAVMFLLLYDFYHLLFSAVLSWFKKG